ncbi:MAG TPA: hypothetical protein PLX06_12305 [Fimbriimonadaceae bacterium]|nr:hypothetical protein [Fimbriimonadaceae bacterium]
MKNKPFGLAMALLAGAALAYAGVQEYTLKRTAKAGEVFRYQMSGELELMGQSVGMKAITVNKTVKVEPNGNYVVESTMTDGKISINGGEMDMPEQTGTTTTFKADGTVVDVKGEGVEQGGWRMANLMSAIVPERGLKVGEGWTSEVKGDTKKQSVDVKGTYTLEAIEKTEWGDAARVKYELKETSGDVAASMSGTAWIDTKTGNMVKMDSVWKDVPIPGAPAPISGKMSMHLLK